MPRAHEKEKEKRGEKVIHNLYAIECLDKRYIRVKSVVCLLTETLSLVVNRFPFEKKEGKRRDYTYLETRKLGMNRVLVHTTRVNT